MPCIYCHSIGHFTDEHILARAFAGPGKDWMLIDLVCAACNKLFSTYERAWTSAPDEAMARIYWGPSGRERQDVAYQIHPSEHVFLISDVDPIAYEVDILRGLHPHFRPQIVLTSSGAIPHASDASDLPRFMKALDAFLNKREITVQKQRSNSFRIATMASRDDFRVEGMELRSRPAGAWLDRFPPLQGVARDPRVSVDAHGRLRIRAASMKQASAMMQAILAQGTLSAPGGTVQAGEYLVAVRSKLVPSKVNRAVAKTLVNYATDEFGSAWIGGKAFRPILDYCLGRIGDDPNAPFVGVLNRPSGIREVDEAPPNRHVLALAAGRGRVVGLVRLYGSSTWRVHLGPAPAGTTPFKRSVWIDFNGPGRVPPLAAG